MVDPRDTQRRWDAEVSRAFQNHAPRLQSSLLGRLHNEQDAWDAVQEVFLRLARVTDRELVGDPVKYLYGIARHVVSEIVERRRRDPVDFNSDLTDHHVEHPTAHPIDKVGDSVETREALARAFVRLRPIERLVLFLIKVEGMTHEEVADALRLSKHTVKKYAVQAMAQLRMDWVALQFGGKEV